ncbi:MAG: phosphomannomutase [Candidatus Omnitrophica bacterium]|nr:phosphomannomutase [Candidatus Omnitrophota bacterium]
MEELNRPKEIKQLKFGTSGLRDEVKFMTDKECYINTLGFISFLKEKGEVAKGDKIAFGGDRRGSTPRIMAAVSKAIEEAGCGGVFCGLVPSPTLAFYSITQGIPSIMVTGSHIPEDRNGIKFTKKSGEVLKSDELDILRNVASERSAECAKKPGETFFNEKGMFTEEKKLPAPDREEAAVNNYVKRYSDVFSKDTFQGRKIALYQHSAVGRDILKRILEELGAEVIPVAKSEKFVPVDTEKVSHQTRTLLKETAVKYKPFAIVSTDGDSDRPLLADETGEFLTGDKLGALVALYLKPDFAAIPISANSAAKKVLTERKVKVEQTKIGSPYVVKAMMVELNRNSEAKVVSWESNGGFLLGSDWTINGKVMKALPTRDAALPLIVSILSALEKKKKMSEFIAASLPARYTYADVIDYKTKNCENYTAEMGKTIIKMFSPEDKSIDQVDFGKSELKVFHAGGNSINANTEEKKETLKIKERLDRYFTKERGFSNIVSINWIDGIRITFETGDVSHLRPSGNAPEFRNYGEAATGARAEEIVAKRFEIIPEMIENISKSIS